MLFPHARLSRSLFIALLLALAGCHRTTPEQQALRAELRKALREQQYEKATELARRNVDLAPRDNNAWAQLVRAQMGVGDLNHAAQSLKDWRARVPKPSVKLARLAGDLALRENDPARAINEWSKLLARDPKDVRVLERMAQAYHAQRDWEKAEATWTRIIAQQESGPALMERALCRRQLHRWPEARADAERAQALAPDDPDVHRGSLLFERLEKFLAEIRELDARLALAPDDDQALTDRALLFLRSQDAELALSDSQLAKKKAPWAVRPILFHALALIDLGRAGEGEALGVEKMLRIDSLTPEVLQTLSRLDSELSVERDNPELLVSRAWQLNDLGQPRLALRDAEEALRQSPEMASALAERSFALAKLDRADEALAEICRATELEPQFATAWQYRGELELARGEWTAAADSLSHALTISPSVAVLEKREQAYRQLGLTEKADEDRHALEALNVH